MILLTLIPIAHRMHVNVRTCVCVFVEMSRHCIMIIIVICKLKTFQQNRVHSHRSNAFCNSVFFAFCDDRKINRETQTREPTVSGGVWVSVWLACWTTHVFTRIIACTLCTMYKYAIHAATVDTTVIGLFRCLLAQNTILSKFIEATSYDDVIANDSNVWMHLRSYVILLLCWIGIGSCFCFDSDYGFFTCHCMWVHVFLLILLVYSFIHALTHWFTLYDVCECVCVGRQYKNWMQQP